MNKILYIGGFEMPYKNAAAQRVLSVAKSLRVSGYETSFYGITHSEEKNGKVDGFHYEAIQYPTSYYKWLTYIIGVCITNYIEKNNPDIVILYNYPAVA